VTADRNHYFSVTDLGLWTAVIATGLVCIFYTTLVSYLLAVDNTFSYTALCLCARPYLHSIAALRHVYIHPHFFQSILGGCSSKLTCTDIFGRNISQFTLGHLEQGILFKK